MKYKTKRRILGISALILAAGLVCFCGAGSAAGGKWFQNSDIATWYDSWGKGGGKAPAGNDKEENPVDPVAISSDGELMTGGKSYAMPRGIMFLDGDTADVETPAARPTEVTAGTLVISAAQSNPYMKGVYDWNFEWADGEGAKLSSPASDYIDISYSGEFNQHVYINRISSFPRQIVLSASLRGGSASSVTSCTLDCVKRWVKGSDWDNVCEFQNNGDGFGGYFFTVEGLTKTVGTVDGMRIRVGGVSVQLDASFIANFKKLLKFNVTVNDNVTLDIPMTLLTDSAVGGYLENAINLSYATFISGFDSFDDAHKEAVYWAWYNAAQAVKVGEHNSRNNATIAFALDQIYNDTVFYININDEGDDLYHRLYITGENLGAGVQFNVTLNNDVVLQA